jgi:zinc transport system ATP-binding protein
MSSAGAQAIPLISLRDVGMGFAGRQVLASVSMDLHRGEILTLIGPNGAGKTTLIKLALGLIEPQSGEVARAPGIRIGYVPQNLTVDAILPLTVGRFLTLAVTARRQRVMEMLAMMDVERLYHSQVQSISGGELRRVLLARALLRDVDLLVLDEPMQGVDVVGQAELYRLLGHIRNERGCGILLVSHDLHLVMAATDRVVCLDHHVCCQGAPESVSRDPEFLRLFGAQAARQLAVYSHDLSHDHTHGHDHDHGTDGGGQ